MFSTDVSSVCGGILDNVSGGNITSPGYLVSNYSNNLNCEWLIQNPQHVNSSIVVIIEDLHLQSDQTCRYDYLQFRLGGLQSIATQNACCYCSETDFQTNLKDIF